MSLDHIRGQFPILEREVHGQKLVYLDSAASSQKPQVVLDAMATAYTRSYANVHRGLHTLSEESTDAYENTRKKVQGLINAPSHDEVVFTSGATMSLNIIARSWGGANLTAGDEILISVADHHANIVPWQMIAQEKGAIIKAAPVNPDGSVSLEVITSMITDRTRVVAMPHVSNVLGTVYPVEDIAKAAHAKGAVFVLDGCQGVVHMPVDVQAIDCDFYVFSGHKLYGPSGIGVLWGKMALLEDMPPFLGGGDMIDRVSIESSTYAPPPQRFEAGTPPIVETIGLGAAIDFVQSIGMDSIRDHELELLNYAHQQLASVDGLEFIGTAPGKSGVVSFTLDCAHPHDISTIVDRKGVAIRAGHHCAQPLMDFMGLPSTARASVGVYTNRADIDALVGALGTVRKIFG
ncbi:MAG: cysteine desulfurase [Alphaproteobacteria bacterium]|nr:cysteine desulfurase [Alphaproteobacteria bacterium]